MFHYDAGPGWILIGRFERRKNSLRVRIHCKLSWTQTGWFMEGGGEGEGKGEAEKKKKDFSKVREEKWPVKK